MAVGGAGVISVTANIVPSEMAQMIDAARRGDFVNAGKLHHKIYPLHEALFLETNPIPVKTALSLLGKCSDEVRLPLCRLSAGNLNKLKKAMQEYGLLRASPKRA